MKIIKIALICCIIATLTGFASETQNSETPEKCLIPSAKSAYMNSKAVFVGEVLSKEGNGDVKTFTFRVEKYWKGVKRTEIKVSVRESMRYEAWFEVGGKYLVFARADNDGNFWDGKCSGTKSLENASRDIKELGKAKKPN